MLQIAFVYLSGSRLALKTSPRNNVINWEIVPSNAKVIPDFEPTTLYFSGHLYHIVLLLQQDIKKLFL